MKCDLNIKELLAIESGADYALRCLFPQFRDSLLCASKVLFLTYMCIKFICPYVFCLKVCCMYQHLELKISHCMPSGLEIYIVSFGVLKIKLLLYLGK